MPARSCSRTAALNLALLRRAWAACADRRMAAAEWRSEREGVGECEGECICDCDFGRTGSDAESAARVRAVGVAVAVSLPVDAVVVLAEGTSAPAVVCAGSVECFGRFWLLLLRGLLPLRLTPSIASSSWESAEVELAAERGRCCISPPLRRDEDGRLMGDDELVGRLDGDVVDIRLNGDESIDFRGLEGRLLLRPARVGEGVLGRNRGLAEGAFSLPVGVGIGIAPRVGETSLVLR